MHIIRSASTSALNRLDNSIALIQNNAMTASESLMLLALEIAQMVFALIFAYSRCMSSLGTTGPSTRPDEVSVVIVDVRSWIEIPVGCEEYVSWSDELWSKDVKVDDGRM